MPIRSDEEMEVINLWQIPPKQPINTGWLVYSDRYLLSALQGHFGHPEKVSNSKGWIVVLWVSKVFLAFAQALIMIMGRIPVLSWFLGAFAQHFGRNPLGFVLRSCFWKAKLKHLGQDTLIDQGVDIWGPEQVQIGSGCMIMTEARLSAGQGDRNRPGSIIIGDYCVIGANTFVGGDGWITIGDFVVVGANARLYSATAITLDESRPDTLLCIAHCAPPEHRTLVNGPITLEEYVCVGIGSVVLPNVRIGLGSIIYPFTLVSETFPALARISGPGKARFLRWRKPPIAAKERV